MAQRRRKHCVLAVVRRSQKFSPRHRPPSRGHGMAKIKSAGDGHYLYLQTQFGEDRCTQFRVIVVTDPQTNKQTNRQDRLQYTVLQLERSVSITEAKDDGGGGDNWSYETCKAPVKSSPPTNHHPWSCLQAGCPSCHPANGVIALKWEYVSLLTISR